MKPRAVPVGVADFDAMDDALAEAYVRPHCASERWIGYVVRNRPYRTMSHLLAASDNAVRLMDWPDVEQALGPMAESWERPPTPRPRGARSPANFPPAAPAPSAEVRAASLRYQERFGHPFLTSGTARTAVDVLNQLHLRLGHDSGVERRIVRAELHKIVRLRLSVAFVPTAPDRLLTGS